MREPRRKHDNAAEQENFYERYIGRGVRPVALFFQVRLCVHVGH